MRFFKSFTLLHRKTKSESNVTVKATPRGHTQTRSLSFVSAQHFDERVLVAGNAIFDAVVPTNVTHLLPITPLPAASLLAQPRVSTQFTAGSHALFQRIRALEAENSMLKSGQIRSSTIENALNHHIHLLKSEISQANLTNQDLSNTASGLQATIEDLQDEIRTTRDHLYDTLHRDILLRRQAKVDDEEIQRLEEQLMQCTKFLGLAIDIGLHEPVLARVQVALRVGENADEALVDSIKEAAARPGSPWARIIPAVTGPRTSDNYISAINATLNVRKELKECKKVAKFWKETAKEGPEHAGTVTPSISKISSVHEVLSEERQYAVDELLTKIKNQSRPSGAMSSVILAPQSAIIDDASGPDNPSMLASTSLSASTIRGDKHSIRNCTSLIPESDTTVRNSMNTVRGGYVPKLAPLASESFKEELVASESFKHLSKRTSPPQAKVQTRTILGEVDLNRNVNTESMMVESDATTTQWYKGSAKSLGKRKAVVVAESIESIKVRDICIPLSQSYRHSLMSRRHMDPAPLGLSPHLPLKQLAKATNSLTPLPSVPPSAIRNAESKMISASSSTVVQLSITLPLAAQWAIPFGAL
jgi:hypothetical protein